MAIPEDESLNGHVAHAVASTKGLWLLFDIKRRRADKGAVVVTVGFITGLST